MSDRVQLENLQIVARPRQHWEALDLGVLIARRWYALLLTSWLAVAAPLFVLVRVVIPEHPIWGMLIVWWFKPVYERIPLRILSKAIFGATPTLKEALHEWRQAVLPGIAHALTYRRLTPARSFEAPVWVLEGLTSTARQKRFSILQVRAGSGAFWLTVLGVHVEAFLVLGLITGVYLFIPSGIQLDWWSMLLSGADGDQDWLVNLLYFVAMAVVAPIYVAAGFALYLNRRVELEAWDIELGFRRLAQRVAGVVLFALGLGLVVPGPEARAEAYADDTNWEGPEPAMVVLSPRRQSSRDAIYDVLAGPDFNQEQVLRYPKFLADLFETDEEPPPQADVEWLVSMIRSVALVAEVLLWAGVIALLLWIVYRARLLDVVGRLQRNRPRERPREIMGLAVDAESLPDDVTAEGMRLWQAGAQREALSLIYRAALTALIDRFNCELNAADTEGECLDKARAVLPESALGYLQVLTRTWQFAAYGHSLPQDSRFAELCGSWPVVFEAEPDDAP